MFVSDVLCADDILKHKRILLIAGLGAGKNTFFENNFSNILIATSRALKRDEGLRNGKVKYTTHHQFGDDVNAGERFNNYDTIVVDEAHALITDATFVKEYFYINKFLENTDKHIVLTTATPQPIFSYCKEHNYHIIDLRKKCKFLVPMQIIITNEATFRKRLEYDEIPLNAFYMDNGQKLDGVMNIAKNKRGMKVKKFTARNKKEPINISSSSNDLIVTTSVMREGINIYNEEPAVVACCSKYLLEALQFCGRFRNGVSKLYLINDAYNSSINEKTEANIHLKYKFARAYNEINGLRKYFSDDELISLSDGYLMKNPYSNELDVYDWKFVGRESKQLEYYKYDKDIEAAIRNYFGEEPAIITDIELINGKKLCRYTSKQIRNREIYDNFRKLCHDTFLENRKYDKNNNPYAEITKEQRNTLIKKAEEMGLLNSQMKPYKDFGRILSFLGDYRLDRRDNRRLESPLYIYPNKPNFL